MYKSEKSHFWILPLPLAIYEHCIVQNKFDYYAIFLWKIIHYPKIIKLKARERKSCIKCIKSNKLSYITHSHHKKKKKKLSQYGRYNTV